MIDKKAQIIHEYELKKSIPEVLWYTEYVPSYECYKIKLGINPQYIDERYSKALIEFQEEEYEDIKFILEITMDHNITDTTEFSSNNLENMLKSFMTRKERLRRVGIKRINEKVKYLLQIRDTDKIPEFLDCTDKELIAIQNDWLAKSIDIYVNIKEQDMQLLLKKTEIFSPKQERVNYQRELKKKCKQGKIYIDENFSSFDFRGIEDLENSIFINCDLREANFSYTRLANVIFVDCNLTDTIFLGAFLNGCRSASNLDAVVDIYKKFA